MSAVTATTTRRARYGLGLAALALLVTGCADAGDSPSLVAGDPATPTAAPTEVETPTEEPTDEPTEDPTDSTSPTPTDEPTDEPTDPPTTTPPGNRIKASEYEDDWNFRLGDAKAQAKHVKGVDYKTCKPAEVKGALTERGCQYAVKVTYRALDGKLMFTNLIIELGNEQQAKKFGKDKTLKDSDFHLEKGDVIPNFTKGQWRANDAGKYAVITFATANDRVSDKQLQHYLHYANADFSSALLFRF